MYNSFHALIGCHLFCRKLRYYINKGLWREPLRRKDGKPYPPDVQRREVKLDIVNDAHKLYLFVLC